MGRSPPQRSRGETVIGVAVAEAECPTKMNLAGQLELVGGVPGAHRLERRGRGNAS
jgi:hypothetical protein